MYKMLSYIRSPQLCLILSLILVVIMTIGITPMFSLTVKADTVSHVSTEDELNDAFGQGRADVIILDRDISTANQVFVGRDTTLDLNGHTLYIEKDYTAITIHETDNTKTTFIVTDSSAAKQGALIAKSTGYSNAIDMQNDAVLIIKNGAHVQGISNDTGNYFIYGLAISTALIIEEGTVICESTNSMRQAIGSPRNISVPDNTIIRYSEIKESEGEIITLADMKTALTRSPNGIGYVKIEVYRHTHTFETSWSANKSKHWHECTAEDCEEKTDEADHTYGTEGNARFTCTVCGYINTTKKAEAEEEDRNQNNNNNQNQDDNNNSDSGSNSNDNQNPDGNQNSDNNQNPNGSQNHNDNQNSNENQDPDNGQSSNGNQNSNSNQNPDNDNNGHNSNNQQNYDDNQNPDNSGNADNGQNNDNNQNSGDGQNGENPNSDDSQNNQGQAENTQNTENQKDDTTRADSLQKVDNPNNLHDSLHGDDLSLEVEVYRPKYSKKAYVYCHYLDNSGRRYSKYIYEINGDNEAVLKRVIYRGKKVIIPDTILIQGTTYKVVKLKKGCLKLCPNATSIDIGKNVKIIEEKVLNGTDSIKTITIRGRLKKVKNNAFRNLNEKATIKIRTSKKIYKHNKKLLENVGLCETVRIKRIKK